MLNALNTKLQAAILVAVTAIGTFLYHEHEVNVRAANAAAQAAAILKQQQDAADAARKHDSETWRLVQEKRKKSNVSPADSGKTWTNYLP